MKIYFAGVSTVPTIYEVGASAALESYLYFRKNNMKLEEYSKLYKDIFLDSGAFTAFTQGEQINIDDYIQFIKDQKKYISIYANLDVIGDSEMTYKNWLYMKEAGLDPLPVIHYGAERKFFEKYLGVHKVKYLALGGLVPFAKKRKKLKMWLDYSYSIIRHYYPVKTHLFGITTPWVLKRYPAYSCDSTGWLYPGKRGRNVVFKNGKMVESTVGKYLASQNYVKTDKLAVKEYLKMEKYMTDLWQLRGITY